MIRSNLYELRIPSLFLEKKIYKKEGKTKKQNQRKIKINKKTTRKPPKQTKSIHTNQPTKPTQPTTKKPKQK